MELEMLPDLVKRSRYHCTPDPSGISIPTIKNPILAVVPRSPLEPGIGNINHSHFHPAVAIVSIVRSCKPAHSSGVH